jgi:cytochrome c biogenesis protein CcdA
MAHLLSLLGLALLDSTSIGTLVVPLMLVIRRRRVEVRPLAVYFTTVCGFYFLLGVGLLVGLDRLSGWGTAGMDTRPALWLQLVAGVILLAFGVLQKDPPKRDVSDQREPADLSTRAMIVLGFGAAIVEVATMVPYLGAIGILGSIDASIAAKVVTLAVYCLVMILPALVLIGLARMVGERVWPRLERFILWAERETAITLLWIAAIVGLYLIAEALTSLGWVSTP